VKHYEIPLLEKEQCAPDVVAYRFRRPEGYEFVAGQWGVYDLGEPAGKHTFTHASAPHDPHLEIMTRLSASAFKVALDALTPGETVVLSGPGGRMRIREGEERVAFLAGGVGITPIRSMLRAAAHTARTFQDALVVYGNRDETCIPYRDELEALDDIGVRVVHALEHPPEGWQGEAGFVTAEMVRRYVDPADGRPFYVAGPPVMVTAMERVLDELGVEGEQRRIERFSG